MDFQIGAFLCIIQSLLEFFFNVFLELRTAEQGKGNDGTEIGRGSQKRIQGHLPCDRDDGVVNQGEIK